MQQVKPASVSLVSPVTLHSGSDLNNLIDLNVATNLQVEVLTSDPVTFWWTIDLGQAVKITKIILQDWTETPGPGFDTGFSLRYSDSPLSASNLGTVYGAASFDSTAYPATQDTTQTGDVTARYWGLCRAGIFLNNGLICTEMEFYTDDFAGGIV